MKVLITGAAGFIGSHLVDHYLARRDEVIAVDNLITGRKENLADHFKRPNFKFLERDICDFDPDGRETEPLDRLDLILDFASPASPFDYLKYPIETMKTAALGTINLLELARRQKTKILIASTSEVYGDPEIHPQREDYWGHVNPVGPRSVYDEGKRFAEALTAAYHRQHEVATRIVRIFNTYGERMREGDGRVIPAMITQALRNEPMTIFGDGTQTRSFCYVSDLVRGLELLTQSDYDRPVNLGNPGEYTILQLAETIKRLTGSSSPLEFRPLPQDDPRKRKPDISRAKELLGWEPVVQLEAGLTRVIDWFRSRI